jgi:hypothetical protein
MSVASLAGYLNTGGGGGSDFNTVTIGDSSDNVILSCPTNNELEISGLTVATRMWVDTNYVGTDTDASLGSLITTGGISADEYISTGNSITLKGNTGDGVLSVSADGTQLLFNGVAVQLTP